MTDENFHKDDNRAFYCRRLLIPLANRVPSVTEGAPYLNSGFNNNCSEKEALAELFSEVIPRRKLCPVSLDGVLFS